MRRKGPSILMSASLPELFYLLVHSFRITVWSPLVLIVLLNTNRRRKAAATMQWYLHYFLKTISMKEKIDIESC